MRALTTFPRRCRPIAILWALAALTVFAAPRAFSEPSNTNAPLTLRVGTKVDFAPFAFVDANGKPAGFSIDLVSAVADAMGARVAFFPAPLDQLLENLTTGEIDLVPSMAITDSRRDLIDFSLPHTKTFDSFFIREGDHQFRDIEDATNHRVIVLKGDYAEQYLRGIAFRGTIVPVETTRIGFQILASGKNDAFLTSQVVGMTTLNAMNLHGIVSGPTIPDYTRTYAFAIHKGDTLLREHVNQALLAVKASGEYDRLYEKYFSTLEPSRAISKWLYWSIGVLLALVIAAAVILVLLRRIVATRTVELSERNRLLAGEIQRRAKVEAELRSYESSLESVIQERTRSLVESEQRLRHIFDLGLIGMALTSPTKGWLLVNDHTCGMLGYTRDELVRMDWASLTHPDDIDLDVAQFTRVLSGEIDGYQLDKRFLRKDGSVISVALSVKCLRHEDRSVNYFVVLLQDITERLRSESELRRMLESTEALWELAKIQEQSHKQLTDFVLTEITRITGSRYAFFGAINPAQTSMTIYSWSKEVMPECRVDDRPLVFELSACGAWADAVRERRAVIINDYSRDFAGKKGLPVGHVPLSRFISVPIFSGDRIVAVAAVANKPEDYTSVDLRLLETFVTNAQIITDRRRAESERAAIERQMLDAQKLESLGVLAGGIAHDFNNILTGILGNASLLSSAVSDTPNAAKYVTRIESAAQRAADLTRQMLAYSGRGSFVVQSMSLSSAVRETLDLVRASVSKNAEIDLRLDDNAPLIKADTTQIRQIIMNLVINASEAIGAKAGRINIRTGAITPDAALINAFTLNGGLRVGSTCAFIEVRDDGCGMDEATKARIFEPFFSTKFVGRGLGLAAVFGIIRHHEGAIQVDSTPDQGTTFRVFFPTDGSPTREVAQEAPKPPRARDGKTVLVVDDEEVIRTLATDILETSGHKVIVASDGAEGLEIYRREISRLDVVLLDLTMRGMQGQEVFREIIAINPTARVVLTSGYTESEALGHFTGQRPAGFIQKPFKATALLAALFPS